MAVKMDFSQFVSGIPAGDYVFQDTPYPQQIQEAAQLLLKADAVLIGAGAGLSTAAGLAYGGKRFTENFGEFIEKYGINALYSLKYQDKFNAALDYFNNFDKATALNELKNNATYYKEQLGNKYYDLLARMNNR